MQRNDQRIAGDSIRFWFTEPMIAAFFRPKDAGARENSRHCYAQHCTVEDMKLKVAEIPIGSTQNALVIPIGWRGRFIELEGSRQNKFLEQVRE